MEVYSRHPIIITNRTKLVVETLGKMVPWLKEQLGDNLLAVTLGGSSVRGLNSLESSDIDYYIYSRPIGKDLGQKIDRESEELLRKVNLAHCDLGHVVVLDKNIPLLDLNSVMGVFAGHLVYRGNIAELQRRAIEMIDKYRRMNPGTKEQLLSDLKADFYALIGTRAEYAAKKYLKNCAPRVIGEMEAVALAFDTNIEEQLQAIARPFIEARKQMVRFPSELESLFR